MAMYILLVLYTTLAVSKTHFQSLANRDMAVYWGLVSPGRTSSLLRRVLPLRWEVLCTVTLSPSLCWAHESIDRALAGARVSTPTTSCAGPTPPFWWCRPPSLTMRLGWCPSSDPSSVSQSCAGAGSLILLLSGGPANRRYGRMIGPTLPRWGGVWPVPMTPSKSPPSCEYPCSAPKSKHLVTSKPRRNMTD